MPVRRIVLRLVLSLTATLVVLEVTLRVVDPFHSAELAARERFSQEIFTSEAPYWPLALAPGVRTRYFGHDVVVGSHGMRNRETPLAKPAGVFRILVLGDSVAFGWGVAEKESFPRVLEERLARLGLPPGKQVEVINSAVPGWGLHDEVHFLREKGMRYEPDLVLAVLVNNDVPSLSAGTQSAPAPPPPSRWRWAEQLASVRLLRALLVRPVRDPAGGFRAGGSLDPTGLEVVCAGLEELRRIAAGVKVAVADTMGSAEVEACCRRAGIRYVRAALPVADWRERYAISPLDDHPNAAAHRLLADAVFQGLAEELR
jgi:lysophospholipase L1-like esterase